MAGDVVSDIQRAYLAELASDGRRMDGRALDEYRPISIETGLIKQAEGSARVRLGKTEVWAGIKMMMGTPYPDSPNSGVLTTSAELLPMASSQFEKGPPSPYAIEVARVCDRGIRESKTVDTADLCVVPGEKVWVTYMDMHVVDYDGNLFDAGSAALLSALMTTQVPNHKFDLGDPAPLPIHHYPVMTTAAKIGKTIVFDPSALEERVARPRLSISTDENGDVRAGQKGQAGGMTLDEVKTVIKEGRVHAESIRRSILDHVKGKA